MLILCFTCLFQPLAYPSPCGKGQQWRLRISVSCMYLGDSASSPKNHTLRGFRQGSKNQCHKKNGSSGQTNDKKTYLQGRKFCKSFYGETKYSQVVLPLSGCSPQGLQVLSGWISSPIPTSLPSLVPLFHAKTAQPDPCCYWSFPPFLLFCLKQWLSKRSSWTNRTIT